MRSDVNSYHSDSRSFGSLASTKRVWNIPLLQHLHAVNMLLCEFSHPLYGVEKVSARSGYSIDLADIPVHHGHIGRA